MKYLLQIFSNGRGYIGDRVLSEIHLDDERIPLVELTPDRTILLWKIEYKEDDPTVVDQYIPNTGELKFK